MSAFRLKLISAGDPDVFQDRLNRFVEDLPAEAMIVDIKFSTAASGPQLSFSALVQYKAVEEWSD